MKLYIDDIRNAPDDTWKVARTVEAAISAVDVFDFDVISIDHDISHQVVMEGTSRPFPCLETFYPVALFLKEKYKTQKMAKESGIKITCLSVDCPERTGGECNGIKMPKVILHTSNPAGAFKMKQTLDGFDVTIKESRPANHPESVEKIL